MRNEKGAAPGGAAFFFFVIESHHGLGMRFALIPAMQTPPDILVRTRMFALTIVRLYVSLPRSVEAQVMGKQLLRSSTSTGAHLREARFSRSSAEMLSKIEVALQELEESRYWLELLVGSEILTQQKTKPLEREIGELIAILVTSARKIKFRMSNSR